MCRVAQVVSCDSRLANTVPHLETTMGLLDNFSKRQRGSDNYVPVDIDFTEEENAAIQRNLSMYQSAGGADPGHTLVVPAKTRDCIIAQGLRYYVADLMRLVATDPHRSDAASLLDKAIRALIKAYAVHNLPMVLFQLGVMVELTGDLEHSRQFFQLFLDQQEKFRPDDIDRTFLDTMAFDIPDALQRAHAKLL